MERYLFRGKTKTGRWAYGSLILAGSYCCVLEPEGDVHPMDYPYLDDDLGVIDGRATPVIPKTIGQYTGLKDKNGVKIFEGDIISSRKNVILTKKLRGYHGVDSDGYPQKVPGYDGESEYHYDSQVACCSLVDFSPNRGYYLHNSSMFVNAICNEVVGNIHDNPELLKGEGK